MNRRPEPSRPRLRAPTQRRGLGVIDDDHGTEPCTFDGPCALPYPSMIAPSSRSAEPPLVRPLSCTRGSKGLGALGPSWKRESVMDRRAWAREGCEQCVGRDVGIRRGSEYGTHYGSDRKDARFCIAFHESLSRVLIRGCGVGCALRSYGRSWGRF